MSFKYDAAPMHMHLKGKTEKYVTHFQCLSLHCQWNGSYQCSRISIFIAFLFSFVAFFVLVNVFTSMESTMISHFPFIHRWSDFESYEHYGEEERYELRYGI